MHVRTTTPPPYPAISAFNKALKFVSERALKAELRAIDKFHQKYKEKAQ